MGTLYINKEINGINFVIEFYFEDSDRNKDAFIPNETGFIEISDITVFDSIKLSDRIYNAVLELEDVIIEDYQNSMDDYFI